MRGCVRPSFARLAPVGACALVCLLLAQCAGNVDSRYGVSSTARLVAPGEPIPKGGGVYHVGNPYMVGGRVYVPQDDPNYSAVGVASWYGEDFHGRGTANGEIFDANSISAAHPTLPLPSYVRVTNLGNGRSIVVRVNDRGPYARNRILDVSRRVAHLLSFTDRGTAWVRVEYIGRAPIEGSDDRMLEATLRENGPAPAPPDVMLASNGPSFPPQPSPPAAGQRFASASPDDAPAPPPRSAPAMSYADPPVAGASGTAQFLNGRGLY
jgi:rare lipoprotein A